MNVVAPYLSTPRKMQQSPEERDFPCFFVERTVDFGPTEGKFQIEQAWLLCRELRWNKKGPLRPS